MKKLFLGLVATAVFLGCLSVSFAADTNTGLVATVSNISPNDQKLVVVAEFTDLANNRIGQNAKKNDDRRTHHGPRNDQRFVLPGWREVV